MPRIRPGRPRPQRLLLVTLVALLVGVIVVATETAAGAAGPPSTQAPQSYFAVDADTGAVVAASNEHAPHLTASTIKVLTALVALEHLPTTASVHVSRLAAGQPAMRIDMQEGSAWPLQQALASLLIVSANDAAYALAENTGGDLEHFDTMAAATARRLGLRDTTFKDPAGLDGAQGFGGGTTSSAYDLAIVARNALAVPEIADDASKLSYDFTDPNGVGRHLVNHNKGFLTTYPGAIGLKTGYTKAASRTLLAAARRDGHTCIASVMGTWDDTGWASYLLDQCFAGVRVAGAATLPPVRATTLQARLDAYRGLPHALGAAGATTTGTAGTAATASAASGTAAAARGAGAPGHRAAPPTSTASAPRSPGPGTAALAGTAPAAPLAASDSGAWSWGTILRDAAIVLLVLVVLLFFLRRRAVRRQRARRIARVQAHAEARRRGMIDVVDPPDGSDIRVLPNRTGHHVAASGRRRSDRRVVRTTRPREHRSDRGRRS